VRRVQDSGKRVELISPGRSTTGLGAVCIAAAREAARGGSTDDVFRLIESASMACDTYAIPRDFDYLERTGDLAIMNSQSNVGPIDGGLPLFRVRGRFSPVAVARDSAGAFDEALARIAATSDGREVIIVLAADVPEGAVTTLTAGCRRALNVAELHIAPAGPTVGSVLGPGSISLGFCVVPPGQER